MKFKKLKLYIQKLNEECKFYSEVLGFELLEQLEHSFTVKVGWTELTFEASDQKRTYHYCFLIPANQLQRALQWMENRVAIVDINNGRKTQRFESWNADSFYFYDASGNIAEFIVRYDLRNEQSGDFDISKVLCVNEMGMPVKNVVKANELLEKALHTKFWKGDRTRFGTNGNQEGIWLLPNYEIKDVWFPTDIKLVPEDFEAVVENEREHFRLSYRKEQITIERLSGH